jgi:polar amino acid transport system substrate-binding protein
MKTDVFKAFTKIFTGLGLLLVTFTANARNLDEIRKSGVIRIGADGATPPFTYYKSEKLVGFEIDLANEIAKRLGLKVEWKSQPFNTLLVAIKQDRFDLIATSHSVTPARAEVIDYVAPHYCTTAVIVSKPGGPKKVTDLVGKTVVVPVGTVYFEKLKTIPGIKEIKTVPEETDGLQVLLRGRADAWVTDQFIAMEALKPYKDRGFEIGEAIHSQVDAMVVSKGNAGLRDAISKELQDLLTDGTYAQLSQKYFNQDIRCK